MKMQIEVEEQQMRELWSLNKAEILGSIGLVVLLLTLGSTPAAADTINTLFCTGGNTCFTSNAGLTSYWTLTSDIALNTSNSTFTFTLTVSATGETNPGFLQDFSGQYFFGGSQLTGLTWTQNPGNWTSLLASKAGNSGSCQGNTPGSFCGAVGTGSTVPLGTTPVTLGITGSYTGTFLDSNGNFNFQAAAALKSDGSGGNVFAISQSVGPGGTTPVPDGGASLMLLGGALVGLEAVRRRFRV